MRRVGASGFEPPRVPISPGLNPTGYELVGLGIGMGMGMGMGMARRALWRRALALHVGFSSFSEFWLEIIFCC